MVVLLNAIAFQFCSLLKFNQVCSLNKLVHRVTLNPHVTLLSISPLEVHKATTRGILAMRAPEECAYGRLTSVAMSVRVSDRNRFHSLI